MASIYRDGSKWRAQVRLKGASESKAFATKAQAQAWAISREADILETGGAAVATGHTLAEALIRYKNEVSINKKGGTKEAIRIDAFIKNMPFIGLLIDDVSNIVKKCTSIIV